MGKCTKAVLYFKGGSPTLTPSGIPQNAQLVDDPNPPGKAEEVSVSRTGSLHLLLRF